MRKQYLPCGHVRIVHGGSEYFNQLKELIDGARESVYIQTYIFSDDITGNYIADSLIAAARRGVRVFVLVDGYASQSLSDEFVARIRSEGIHFRFFEPLFKSNHFYFGRRLHHKISVVDEEKAIVCGLNISDRYNDLPERRAWYDLGLFVDGEAAKALGDVCYELWHKKQRFLRVKKRNYSSGTFEKDCNLRICRNDWLMSKQEISKSYMQLFGHAKESITIMCSYFLPGSSFRSKLRAAAKRGVEIKIVLAGMSDIATVKYAERYLYRWLLRHHIKVYEYQPCVLHAKLAIADGQLLTIGSYNINDLSANASIELNIEVNNRSVAAKLQKEIDGIIKKDCIRIHPKQINIYSFKHFLQWLSYYLIRITLKLGTFYFRQKE